MTCPRILDIAARIFVWLMLPAAAWLAASEALFGWTL